MKHAARDGRARMLPILHPFRVYVCTLLGRRQYRRVSCLIPKVPDWPDFFSYSVPVTNFLEGFPSLRKGPVRGAMGGGRNLKAGCCAALVC